MSQNATSKVVSGKMGVENLVVFATGFSTD